MDRRHFLAAGSLAAVSPVLGHAAVAGGDAAPSLFRRVNFTSDGVDYSPAEYATRLHEVATRADFAADYYSLGGAVESLEKKFAALLRKPAAMFVPTGTLANHLAIRRLAGRDQRVLVQAESHYFNDSGDGAQALSGLTLVPMGLGQADVTLDEVKAWVERSAGGRVKTPVGVISIESPVRRRDHAMADFGEMQRVAAYAREQGIRLHLDGARLFNLPLHSGKSLTDTTALFDTVYVSLWKHFNGASGAILAGDAAFIEGLFHQRRLIVVELDFNPLADRERDELDASPGGARKCREKQKKRRGSKLDERLCSGAWRMHRKGLGKRWICSEKQPAKGCCEVGCGLRQKVPHEGKERAAPTKRMSTTSPTTVN